MQYVYQLSVVAKDTQECYTRLSIPFKPQVGDVYQVQNLIIMVESVQIPLDYIKIQRQSVIATNTTPSDEICIIPVTVIGNIIVVPEEDESSSSKDEK